MYVCARVDTCSVCGIRTRTKDVVRGAGSERRSTCVTQTNKTQKIAVGFRNVPKTKQSKCEKPAK